MSTLTKVLAEQIRKIEEEAQVSGELHRSRLTHHLMPPTGWLNDPNGLCYFKGRYHVFFQYSPFEAEGGLKFWGHYSSEDMVSWKYEGVPLLPDSPGDCHGVYSGSALVDGEVMHLFYTGNVKLDGDYDYINNGRVTGTFHVESRDGIHFSPKTEVIAAADYPKNCTCHIRDPKVWKEDGAYRMVLGARRKDDHGAVLFYRSQDGKQWEFEKELTTEKTFGYMWECPDLFRVDGEEFLSVSPQGVEREAERFQNLYQSGYFPVKDGRVRAEEFREWDMGFDFYAPQTFLDGKGRRLLIGWMGMPDEKTYWNPTVEEGWQHCLTVPREITYRDGALLQYPVEELEQLRREGSEIAAGAEQKVSLPFDLDIEVQGAGGSVSLGGVWTLEYGDGKACLRLSEQAGAGRTCRRAKLLSGNVNHIRILADTTAAEIYLNHGETVFSTRYYPGGGEYALTVNAEQVRGAVYSMAPMKIS